jgi:hypothetical protein
LDRDNGCGVGEEQPAENDQHCDAKGFHRQSNVDEGKNAVGGWFSPLKKGDAG